MKIFFHLAENPTNPDLPFAFLATCTFPEKSQQIMLKPAIDQLANDKNLLSQLMTPLSAACETSKFLSQLLNTGAIFGPVPLRAFEAHNCLLDIPKYEAHGITVKTPDWWSKGSFKHKPELSIHLTDKKPAGIGVSGMLSFNMNLSLGSHPITTEELIELSKKAEGLVPIRGKWVEVDHKKIAAILDQWNELEGALEYGIPIRTAMRILNGAYSSPGEEVTQPPKVKGGQWLEKFMALDFAALNLTPLPETLPIKATLRPYQKRGVEWLWHLHQLNFGACLADDMGLGKTIQVLSYLALISEENPEAKHLLIVPLSLIANWEQEAKKFTPQLSVKSLHRFDGPIDSQISITTYGMLLRDERLATFNWDTVVFDEAQALKNPNTKQTSAACQLKAQHRLALTGTPIENRASDLWSIFNCISPGLLGSAGEFGAMLNSADRGVPTIQAIINPFILRRLKTDPLVIQDLPEKTEVSAYCSLSPLQAILYDQAVADLSRELVTSEGIIRKSAILKAIMRFKQIINHPSQWLGTGEYLPDDSGKFLRLREICETIKLRGEKVLIFTQFKALTEPLAEFLTTIFQTPGLVLHGGTSADDRKKFVSQFQESPDLPFFVLSLKAGGTGLNLTKANHVIHFDRWWNPAIEDQATDRAFRIGQKNPVLVHKFISTGTFEEKIDILLQNKRSLSRDLLASNKEISITEYSDSELLELVSLSYKSAPFKPLANNEAQL